MKKTVCFLLISLFLLPVLCFAEDTGRTGAMFTGDEFNEQTSSFLQALSPDSEPREEDGVLLYDAGIADLILAAGEIPSADAVIEEAHIKDSTDSRGLTAGSTLEDVLTAYPNDNPSLKGTEYTVLLYMETDPREGKVRCGWAERNGQTALTVNYAEFEKSGNSVFCRQISYIMEDDIVASVCLYRTKITRADLDALLIELSGSLETGDFTPSPVRNSGSDLDVFRREDLIFSGMDLMDLTPELSELIFGVPPADKWLDDADAGRMRVCEWEDARIVFLCDAQENFISVKSLTIMSEALAGPRGVRYGDSLYSVMHRFRFEEGSSVLYGNAPVPPYGEISRIDDTAVLRYATEAEGKTVILCITFSADKVCDILLSVQD